MQADKPSSERRQESRQRLTARRKKKHITLDYLQPLFEEGIASSSPVNYARAKRCGCSIRQEDGKLKSTYCNKRFCVVCNNRRTAILIDRFEPTLLNDIKKGYSYQHIVLTVPTKNGNDLKKDHSDLWEIWDKTRNSIEYHLSKGNLQHICKDDKLTAVVKSEINFKKNDKYPDGKYHPHLHLLVRGNGRLAKAIKKRWVKFAKKVGKRASYAAQDSGPVYSTDALLEVFKYLHKPTTEDGDPYPPEAIDAIFRTIRGRRIVRAYGDLYDPDQSVKEQVEEDLEDYDPNLYAFKRIGDKVLWNWDGPMETWVDEETGQLLIDPERLTSKDKSDKSNSTPPADTGRKGPLQAHSETLSPSVTDKVFKERIKQKWKEHRAELGAP